MLGLRRVGVSRLPGHPCPGAASMRGARGPGAQGTRGGWWRRS